MIQRFAGTRFRLSLIVILVASLAWLAGGLTGLNRLNDELVKESFRYSQLVENELNRYRTIPELIAQYPLLAAALKSPQRTGLIQQANVEMARMAKIVGSSDVYLMDATGMTIAASNHLLESSFVGQRFDFRPYFQDAIETHSSAQYFALGTTSDVRGLYFSHPVMDGDSSPLGVIAMKVRVEELESQWRQPNAPRGLEMVVLDYEGISFMASRRDWRYRDFGFANEDFALPESRDNIRYPHRLLQPVALTKMAQPIGAPNGVELVVISAASDSEYLTLTLPLPRLDWELKVLITTRSLLLTRLAFVTAALLMLLGCALAWLYLRERYQREAELALRGEHLEQMAAERTAELRETQQELIQAAKLAVLGQMSAGLNHEINQPLTAIQTYARNAGKFLQRGEVTIASDNLDEIVRLCTRMALLIKQFKVFARKSEGPPASLDIRPAIDAALNIVMAQQVPVSVGFNWDRPTEPVICHGDLIRLEQVMVNLITNAVQAVADVDSPTIEIEVSAANDLVIIEVSDNGPGLPADSEQLFEPFYTTKSISHGLGLGLSISRQIVEALGGRLTGRNRTDGSGAEFRLSLNSGKSSK